MKYTAAMNHYKTHAALASAAGVSKQAVTRWAKTGLVPEASAWRLTKHSNNRLKINLKDYERVTTSSGQQHPT